MDVLELIEHAKEIGLDLRIVDGALRIRGPRRHAGIVQLISASKEEVIGALSSADSPLPTARKIRTSVSADTDTRPEIAGVEERVSAQAGGNSTGRGPFPACRGETVGDGERSGSLPSGSTQGAIRLCGHRRPQPSPIPPPEIWADPVALCPRCSSRRVLKELWEMTAGLCYQCWEEGRS